MSNYDRRPPPNYEQVACLERMNAELEATIAAVNAKLDEYIATGDPVAVSYGIQLKRVMEKTDGMRIKQGA